MRRVLGLVCGALLSLLAVPAARAQLAPPQSGPPSKVERATTMAGVALARGDYQAALAAADQGIEIAPGDAWSRYDRGSALRGLKRTDEAVAEFRNAQTLFGQRDQWGRSIAMWGEADAYNVAGRCPEAARAYAAYATYVQAADPGAADMARRYAADCVPAR